MLVRAMLHQQAQTANPSNQTNQRTERAERPERPERRERPERPERPERAGADVGPGANQIIVRNGVPAIPDVPAIPPIPSIQVHTGAPGSDFPPQVVDIAFGFFIMVAVILIGWPLARAFGRRLERGQSAAIAPAVSEQLQRIEQAVDAMAIEVERISEAQRYLTKVQTGRITAP